MKTKIEIHNGHAKIVLTPENEFETTLIDNSMSENYIKTVRFTRDYNFGEYKNRKITIELEKEIKTNHNIKVQLD